MSNGTVKFYNESKGFGFIKDANSSKEYFVHSTGLKDRINENDEVTFDLEEGKKGLNAVNVKLAQFIQNYIHLKFWVLPFWWDFFCSNKYKIIDQVYLNIQLTFKIQNIHF